MNLPPLPEPFDYCYEWDGPYGTRKFSSAKHNGNTPTRSVPIYTTIQMRAYATAAAEAARAEEREACAKIVEDFDPGCSYRIRRVLAAAIRARGE